MSDRDTQFRGWAERIWEDIDFPDSVNLAIFYEDDFQEAVIQYLAQCGYDLVQYACTSISDAQVRSGVRLHPNAMLREVPDPPDLPS